MTPHNCKKYINSSPDMDCDCSSCLEGETAVNEVKSVRYGDFEGINRLVIIRLIKEYEELLLESDKTTLIEAKLKLWKELLNNK